RLRGLDSAARRDHPDHRLVPGATRPAVTGQGMLTLFAIPKAFRGHTGIIQRNAIGSWARLGGGSRVILFGDEEGTAAVPRELHLEHVPEVERNEFGTPLVSALFRAAREV